MNEFLQIAVSTPGWKIVRGILGCCSSSPGLRPRPVRSVPTSEFAPNTLITQNQGMTQRKLDQAKAQRAQLDDYVRTAAGAGSPTAEIERAKQLLDSGAITPEEFAALKQKALA